MKNIHVCILISIFSCSFFSLVSCSSDATNPAPEEITTEFFRIADALPGNVDNPYDSVGWVHAELVETYLSEQLLDTSLLAIVNSVETIANRSAAFMAIKSPSYQSVSVGRIQTILDHPDSCVASVLSNSSLSSYAQMSLSSFIHSFVAFTENETDAEVLYQAVVAYETQVLADSLFTATDQRIALTTTSIARHSTYAARKKPKKNTDPDWTIFIANIAAAVEGARDGGAEAVVMAVVAGIAQNR